jgi:hypothetical protein
MMTLVTNGRVNSQASAIRATAAPSSRDRAQRLEAA